VTRRDAVAMREVGAEHAARARPIVDDQRLPKVARKFLRDEARELVGRATGGTGDDQPD